MSVAVHTSYVKTFALLVAFDSVAFTPARANTNGEIFYCIMTNLLARLTLRKYHRKIYRHRANGYCLIQVCHSRCSARNEIVAQMNIDSELRMQWCCGQIEIVFILPLTSLSETAEMAFDIFTRALQKPNDTLKNACCMDKLQTYQRKYRWIS